MIGIHVSKNSHILEGKHKTMLLAIKKEDELLNMSAVAFFTHGPRNKNINHMDYQGIKKYTEEKNMSIFTHGSYISTGIWGVNQKNRHENKSLMFIRHIKDLLISGKQAAAKGVVVHLPRGEIEQIVETMEILSDCKVINSVRKNEGVLPSLILEMPASRPDDTMTYETAEKLNALCKALTDNPKVTLNWSICIDTAHQYSCAVNFAEPVSWNTWLDALSDVTRGKIVLIHLNGADAKNYGTGKDVHMIPCSKEDAIWGKLVSDEFREYLKRLSEKETTETNLFQQLSPKEMEDIKNSSLFSIVQFAKKNNVAMICEINRGVYQDSKFIIDLINGLLKL